MAVAVFQNSELTLLYRYRLAAQEKCKYPSLPLTPLPNPTDPDELFSLHTANSCSLGLMAPSPPGSESSLHTGFPRIRLTNMLSA